MLSLIIPVSSDYDLAEDEVPKYGQEKGREEVLWLYIAMLVFVDPDVPENISVHHGLRDPSLNIHVLWLDGTAKDCKEDYWKE